MQESLAGLAGRLRLSPRELEALRTCGAICAETRAAGTAYKLRFRLDGRQQVRFLGRDREWIETVRRALEAWQVSVRFGRELKRMARDGRRRLRVLRKLEGPVLNLAGLRYHGTRLRVMRREVTGGEG